MEDNKEIIDSPRKVKILVWLVIGIVLFRFINFLPTMPAPIYYGIFSLFALITTLFKAFKLNLLILMFIIVSYLSILAYDIPSYFHPYERYFGFVIIITVIGPLIQNKDLFIFRFNISKYLMIISVMITVISFILYWVYKPITISERGNLFCGITSHSMQMGPIAGMSFLYLVNYLFTRKNLCKINIILLVVGIVLCLLSCVLASSRAALIATLGALMIWALLFFNSIKKFFNFFVFFMVVVLLTSPLWWSFSESIQGKMAYSESKGSLLVTRQGLWQKNIKTFKDNPFFGSGFASMDIGRKVVKSDYKGTIEPGSGWLYILGSCGIITFLCIVYFYIKTMIELIHIRDENSLLLLALLSFFMIHSFAEAYILSAGNVMFFYLWSTLGTSSLYISHKKLIKAKND